jgi:transcriptional regulator with XRE-family HTH domain
MRKAQRLHEARIQASVRRQELVRVLFRRSGCSNVDEFAELIGKSRATVYRWLSGETRVSDTSERWLLRVAGQIVSEGDKVSP